MKQFMPPNAMADVNILNKHGILRCGGVLKTTPLPVGAPNFMNKTLLEQYEEATKKWLRVLAKQ